MWGVVSKLLSMLLRLGTLVYSEPTFHVGKFSVGEWWAICIGCGYGGRFVG